MTQRRKQVAYVLLLITIVGCSPAVSQPDGAGKENEAKKGVEPALPARTQKARPNADFTIQPSELNFLGTPSQELCLKIRAAVIATWHLDPAVRAQAKKTLESAARVTVLRLRALDLGDEEMKRLLTVIAWIGVPAREPLDVFLADYKRIIDASVARDGFTPLTRRMVAIRATVQSYRVGLGKDDEKATERLQELRSGYEMTKKEKGKSSTEFAIASLDLGDEYFDLGELDCAEKCAHEALAVFRKQKGADALHEKACLHLLAHVEFKSKELARCLYYLERELALSARLKGEKSLEVAKVLVSLANVARDTGELKVARSRWEQALTIFRELNDGTNDTALEALENLGAALRDLKKYDQSEKIFTEYQKNVRERFGEGSNQDAQGMHSLGLLYTHMKNHEKARPLFLNALKIARDLPKDHLTTALYAESLGLLYQATEQWRDAEMLLWECHNTRMRVLGSDHPDTIKAKKQLDDLKAKTARP